MKNSLLEFTELLKNRLPALFEEAGNGKYICLYLADGYWTAFENLLTDFTAFMNPCCCFP